MTILVLIWLFCVIYMVLSLFGIKFLEDAIHDQICSWYGVVIAVLLIIFLSIEGVWTHRFYEAVHECY